MKKTACLILALLVCCCAAACGAREETRPLPAAEKTAEAVQAAAQLPAPTPALTAEPSPQPTPTMEVTELSGAVISRRNGLTFTADTLTYGENSLLRLTLAIENGTNQALYPALDALTVNGWMMDGDKVTFDAPALAPGETGEAVISVNAEDFAGMGLTEIVELGCRFSAGQAPGEALFVQSGTVKNPAADPAYRDPFVRGDTVLLDGKGLFVALQSCDESMRTVTLYLEKTDKAAWTTCCVAPVCNGYTDYLNPVIRMEKGSRMLLTLDNGAIFRRNGITSLANMDVYLTTETPAKIDNAVRLTVTNPAGTDTAVSAAKDESPVVFQDKYAILRYEGIDETIFEGRQVILIDLENITQTYIKTMEITAYPAHATIRLDGTEYPLETHCTYSYPTTHGYLMLWPAGAPEGALKNASEAAVKLKLARFRSGHFDPVTDTGWFVIPLR